MNICLKTSTKIGGIMYSRTVVSIYSEGGSGEHRAGDREQES